ncbi:hypothetical protein EKO23_22505 [Nocardioides guangzhouensis]|uniref:Uncharacterized protein n=1 Tax=Nocardioides guangzhouensis TaxID=2497878 RepID=A0A4Q4Z539_9ACTN|nr:hypothetical protein [Nocardioides guangzhouensis]RYP82131.1 hypothetical protein EKO23_22505 [Nocardioides guangzhouensis]
MTADISLATGVAAALKGGLAAAKAAGDKSVRATHLAPEQLHALVGSTLDHLRSRPGKPSPTEGWTLVTARDAGVTAWWAEVAGLTDAERRRVGPLRRDVFDALAEQDLIAVDTERSTSVHVSPVATATTREAEPEPHPADPADPFGAWVLTLSPYVYDANRVFAAPDRKVRLWSVDDERAASMEYGQPVYLWVADGDPFREAGVWGVGWIAGPCIRGIAGEGWLDVEAAIRANVFAVLEVTLLDTPVSREAFLEDPRLVDADVLRDPIAPNPGVLDAAQAAALAEHLGSRPLQSETWVA